MRLAGGEDGPAALERVIEPARREWARTCRVPEWCGVDFLRGWAFHIVRADRHAGGYGLEPGGSDEPEFEALLRAIDTHPGITSADRPPLTCESIGVLEPTERLQMLLCDNDPWNRHLITAWRTCAEPDLVEPPTRPAARPVDTYDWGVHSERISFFAPLLHVLMFGLGWARPDLGITRWIDLGRLVEEPVLRAVQRWWGQDAGSFVAWMSVSSVAQSQVHALLTSTPAEQVDWVDDRYASLRSEPEWETIWGGGSDSMHLTGHVEAPLGPTARETFPTTPELDSHG